MSKIPQWKLDRIEAQRQYLVRQEGVRLRKACEQAVSEHFKDIKKREAH